MKKPKLNIRSGKSHLISTQKISENEFNIDFESSIKFLSEVLSKLPSGQIHKGKTGVGATSLEIKARRNSIIVEPLKVIASSKSDPHLHLYVGSPTKTHPKNPTVSEIEKYLSNPEIKYKKIICVINSLPKVLNAIPKEKRKDYFLMLDESDSLQYDSGYRMEMNKAYNCFKKHPSDKKCLISATFTKFNDPDLIKFPVYHFNFKKEGRDVFLKHTDNLIGSAHDQIFNLYQSSPEEKIVVAYNNVQKLHDLANFLVLSGVAKERIGILCSANSKEVAMDYYKELTGTQFPTQITLKTSAYFSGFDISEKYHLILPTSPSDFLNILTERKITQIAGRARNGLHSLTIFLHQETNPNPKIYSFQKLKEIAESQIRTLDCIHNNFKHNEFLEGKIKDVFKDLVSRSSFNGFELVDNFGPSPKINYLSIDAILEIQNEIETTYSKIDGLKEMLLSEGHRVEEPMIPSGSNPNIEGASSRENRVKELENIFKNKSQLAPFLYEDSIIKEGIQAFLKFRGHFNVPELKKEILRSLKSSKSFKNFLNKAEFEILSANDPIKASFTNLFPLNETFTKKEIIEKMKTYFSSMSINLDLTTVSVTQELKKRAQVKVVNNQRYQGENARFKIISYSPLGIPKK